MSRQHDHGYKNLFSHPEMVRDLLEGFVKADWLGQLDYRSLEKVNGSYITDDMREREDDIIWRVRWGDGWLYIYLLIEFQSTIDAYMAVRVLTYLGLLYQDLIKTRQLPASGQLPPVLPIVLYNGTPRWNAAEDIQSLIQPGPQGLEQYRPGLSYLLIDEGRYANSELEPLRNLVAALFRLENSRRGKDIDRVITNLIDWLQSPEQRSLHRAFSVWLGRVIIPKFKGEPITHIGDLREMRTMLADRIDEWSKELRAKGRREGRRKGRQEGRQEGERAVLRKLLTRRFGTLDPATLNRLEQASTAELERWAENILDAHTLEEVFTRR